MTCLCDEREHPRALDIAAGQKRIHRQIALFEEFRAALLSDGARQPALREWRVGGRDDLGVMLLEMWAYVSDVLAFYDEVIAHECYLRTARLRPSLRKLVGLLGYRPRPAVGSSVRLAALADGTGPVVLPAGTRFRSSGFGGEPPQVFELSDESTVHPLTNGWRVGRSRRATFGPSGAAGQVEAANLLLERGSARVSTGQIVVVYSEEDVDGTAQIRTVSGVKTITDEDGEHYVEVELSESVSLPASLPLRSIGVATPTRAARLAKDREDTTLVLESVERELASKDALVLELNGEYGWFRAEHVTESGIQGSIEVDDAPQQFTIGNRTTVTLGADLSAWEPDDWRRVRVHHSLGSCGRLTVRTRRRLGSGSALSLLPPVETPPGSNESRGLLLLGADGRGLEGPGVIDFGGAAITLAPEISWTPGLRYPVEVFGNVIEATRGESVRNEVLGSGDASIANQSFKLKKKPLTYLPLPTAENEAGVGSTLEVWVNGFRWEERPTFFGVQPDARVFIVRQNDEGNSAITFGDGLHGARLPSGRDNVIAHYRFGAGRSSPPAGGITQIATPVKGLRTVRNPVAAGGGDDPEPPEQLRANAPKAALILGRAVSIQDMEAVAAAVPGVHTAAAEWRWSGASQRPVVQVWFASDADLTTTIRQRLRSVSDPSTPINVSPATAVASQLRAEVAVDPRRAKDAVVANVRKALLDEEEGLLTPAALGIGRPLFRSRIFEVALAVPGVTAVTSLELSGAPLVAYGMKVAAGSFLDFSADRVAIDAARQA